MKKKLTVLFASLLWLCAFSQNNALNFDGVDDYVTVPQKAGVLNGNAFTIEMWIKPNSAAMDLQMIADNISAEGIYLYLPDAYSVEADVYTTTNAGSVYYSLPSGSWSSAWHHIAVSYNGSSLNLYVDGNLGNSTPLSGQVTSTTNPLFIGEYDYNNYYYYNGSMDELRFWNVARTQAQIQANMNTEILPTTANLTAYYRFNQGTANGNNTGISTITDAMSSPNNGTLLNFAKTGTTSNFTTGFGSLFTLPVTDASFTAVKKAESIQLIWKAMATQGASVFTIERSANSTNFSAIGTVNGVANNADQVYSFTDPNPLSVSYYRIRSTEFDGSESYSKVIAVRMNDKGTNLFVYPNPAHNSLQIQLMAPKGAVEVELKDLSGRTIRSLYLSSQGNAIYTSLDVSRLPRGTYFLKSGDQSTIFIKQ